MLHILASVISYDIWFYVSHVLLHSPILYKYHKQHHVHVHPTWPDTFDADPVENAFQGIGMFFPYAFVTYSTTDTLLIAAFIGVRGMLRHDPRGSWIVGDYHLIHHANPSYNYGEPWLDKLCGTAAPASSATATATAKPVTTLINTILTPCSDLLFTSWNDATTSAHNDHYVPQDSRLIR